MRHHTPVTTVFLFSSLCLTLLGLSGCGSQESKPVAVVASTDAYVHAKKLYLAEDYTAATEAYLALAELDPRNKIKYQLDAIDALIRDQRIDRAQQLIKFLSQEKLNNIQSVLKRVYQAQIFLAGNEADAAYQKLNFRLPSKASRILRAKFHAIRATILQLKKEYFAVARERIILNAYLINTQESADNYQNIWQNLSQLSPDALNNYRVDNVGPLNSWLELAIINRTLLANTRVLQTSITAWQQKYPNHPAFINIIPNILENSKMLTKQVTQIALLLPSMGKYNNAAIAIREGFMAARYASRSDKPTIKIYNTDADNIITRYTQAISEGADMIVGPLQKSAIKKLIEHGDITITTLALNQYNGTHDVSSRSNTSPLPAIIQFSLSPEEEAKQVAERAWFDGHVRAISITAFDKRSQRIHDAFTSHWQELGGIFLEHVSIGEDVKELHKPIKNVLNIDQSEKRNQTLRSVLGRSLKTEIRRRQDVDLIFMVVTPAIARQLVPQLHYYGTENISLYSISNIYTGNINTREDSDINGVWFVDMPWAIDPTNEYSTLRRMIEHYQKPTLLAYNRLYAFGIDAYRLIPRLTELSLQPNQQYEGKTGYLKINHKGQVQRRLIWAQFLDGKPELTDINGLN